MGQLSNLHSKLLRLKLDTRTLADDARKQARQGRSVSPSESKALAEAAEHLWRTLDALYGKANFNPNQPRVPRGNPDGGQWTDDPAHGGDGALQTGRSATRRRPPGGRRPPRGTRKPKRPRWLPNAPYSVTPDGHIRVTIEPRPQGWRETNESPPSGDNSGIPKTPDERLPDVPRERPPTAKQRHSIVKAVARIGLKLVRAMSPFGRLMDLFEIGNWLYEEFAPWLEAYWDEPKTIEELRHDASFPAKGYDIHHVNEQTASRKAGYSEELVNGPENLVRISRLMHWRITAYYMTPNKDYGGLTPRQKVDTLRTWEERTEFGLEVLRKFGVLK